MTDIRKVIARMEPVIRRAFIDAIRDIRSEAQLAVIVRALEDGRVDDAIRALQLDPAFYAPLDDALRAAYLEGGRDALAGIPRIPDPFSLARWFASGSTGATAARKTGSGSTAAD